MIAHDSSGSQRRRPSLACALLSLLASVHLACSSTTSAEPSSGAAEAPTTTPAPVEDTPDPVKEACAAETVRLQAGLDKARDPRTNAVLAVKNPACGVRVLTSGPSKLDGTELHRIGSVTKTYVAAVVLTLARDGVLGLDDAIGKWVSDVPGADGITVRQLLAHTSGLFNYTDDKTFRSKAITTDRVWQPRELVAVAVAHPPYFAPGGGWHYSNTNYVLLGMIAENAGKAKIGALVRARVLTPINATATFFDGEEPVAGTLTLGFDAQGDDMRRIGPSWAWAAGAMLATPADLVTWTERLGSGAFYDAAQQKEVTTTVATEESTLRYGLGMMVLSGRATLGAGTGYGHGGDTPGYHTQAFHFPAKGTTIVSIVDSDAAPANDVSAAALTVLFAPR